MSLKLKFFKRKSEEQISAVVILAVIFGFSAGLVGQIFSSAYFDPWRQYLVDIQLQGDKTNVSVTIPELKKVQRVVGTAQDLQISQAINQIDESIVGFYALKKANTNMLQQIYIPSQLLGSGFVLTSDGWLVTDQSVIGQMRAEQLVVFYKKQQYAVGKLVKDQASGAVFVKIDASNLPVVVLGDSQGNFSGQTVFVSNSTGDINITNIKQSNYVNQVAGQDYVMSTEKQRSFILLPGISESNYLGAPLVNVVGEVIGIINGTSQKEGALTAVPIHSLRSVLISVLKSGTIIRPFLGINYIDLSSTVGLVNLPSQGALVYGLPLRNSPAAEAGVINGDVIVSVDGKNIDSNNNLTEIIQQYKSGDKVDLKIIRNDQTLNLSPTLSLAP